MEMRHCRSWRASSTKRISGRQNQDLKVELTSGSVNMIPFAILIELCSIAAQHCDECLEESVQLVLLCDGCRYRDVTEASGHGAPAARCEAVGRCTGC